MTLAVLGAFALATLVSQAWLRGRKVQSALAGVAAIHVGVLALAVAVLGVPHGAGFAAGAAFWAGAALAWFIVRSHLESSILFALVETIASGCADRREVLARFDAHGGLRVRLDELRAAGLIDDRAVATRKSRLVLVVFDRIGAPAASEGPAARRPSAP